MLHQSLMPMWTSDTFVQLADTCRRLVDELANMQLIGNGREEMTRCEAAYKQVLWLWPQLWPDPTQGQVHAQEHSHAQGHEDLATHAVLNGSRGHDMSAGGSQHVDADADGVEDDEDTAARHSIGGPGQMSYMSTYGVGHAAGQPMNMAR